MRISDWSSDVCSSDLKPSDLQSDVFDRFTNPAIYMEPPVGYRMALPYSFLRCSQRCKASFNLHCASRPPNRGSHLTSPQYNYIEQKVYCNYIGATCRIRTDDLRFTKPSL